MNKKRISQPSINRRKFVKTTALSAISMPYIVPSAVINKENRTAPNDKINLGIIGCGGLGKANLQACMQDEGVELVAACDVWSERLDPIVEKYKSTCTGYRDFRKLLEHPDLDAVIIATPAHWHALQAVAAAEAGVDVYLQKPMSMFPAESLVIRNAFRKHGTINQIGTQIHAGDHYRRMVELVRSGNLGAINTVRTFFVMNEAPNGVGSGMNTGKVPSGLDWDFWVGPSPMQSFNPNLVKDAFYHCFWMDFSGGWTLGMAPHITDLPIWALELGYPTEISAMGGRYTIRDDGDAYDNHEVIWQYPNLTMTWMQSSTNSHGWAFQNADKTGKGYETGTRRRLGIYFHGVNGTLITDYNSHILIPEGDRMAGMSAPKETIPSSPGQELEWLNAVRKGEQPLCNADYHIKVDMPIQLSILSLKLGRSIKFDPESEEIIGDKKAKKMAVPEYRDPWKFPSEYL
ncbi:Gfo/Idh/MocA family protein [Membranihabitans maritimus]|uniref:Gfo/Idh/MocA family protein n=1 Tax=Membranihabitans maritimus TaxID=2904244 RepID=UPI001F1E2810|nr:Gfo/Idh/MocA family oxidoreductase [Membranihabitans maritimus]